VSLDFVAIDFETANFFRGSACAIGMTTVVNGEVRESKSELIYQEYFDGFNMAIHGITPEDVAEAPTFAQKWPQIQSEIGSLPVVAHNAAFDIGVIRDALDEIGQPWPEMTYACTLTMGRRTYQGLPSYRLPFVAEAAGVAFDPDSHHKAETDSEVAARIMLDIVRRHELPDLEQVAAKLGMRLGRVSPVGWQGCTVQQRAARPGYRASASDVIINENADPDNPFFGLGVTFTGALSSMTRALAWQNVADFGGSPLASVTKHTNLLVFGYQDASHLAPGATKSAKFQKAEGLRAKGQDIEIIGEDDFLALLQEAGLPLGRSA
jgi:DNA polymerase III epsilon subunit-like protein